MAQKTIVSVQPFVRVKGGIGLGAAYEVSSERLAKRYAEERIDGESVVGAVAISQTGDPQLGDWEEPVILGVYGEVPEEG